MAPAEKTTSEPERQKETPKPLLNQDTALVSSEIHLRSYIEAALRTILAVSQDGRIVFMNGHTEEIFGYTRAELFGQDSAILLPPRFRAAYATALQTYFAAPSVRVLGKDIDLAGRRKNGEEFPIEIGLSYVQAQEGVIAIGFVSDITDRNRVRDELAHANAELRRSNADLEQFASMASHDLQEPLRIVTSYLGLLERRHAGQLDAEAREFIDFAVDGATRMKGLIQDLLTFSRAGRQSLDVQNVPAESLVRRAVDNLKAAIEERSAQVSWDQPLPEVAADAGLLVQVFQNLVANGIKFQNNGVPRVHVSVDEQATEWVFSVRDNGIGIDPRHSGRIFRIFERLNASDQYSGTGMGLAISQKIAERHGGRIWFDSQPGEGSTFFFSIPRPDVAHALSVPART
jgi:PAS domain S-box-containing protein